MNLRAQNSMGTLIPFEVFDIIGHFETDEDYFLVKDVPGRLICRTLERGTGMDDKNGVEIYEGDLLHIHKGSMKTSKPVLVIMTWSENEEWYAYTPHGMMAWAGSTLREKLSDIKIIGNIHNNPELLDAKI